jgi:DNA-binding NarL/FixJ family response regulator
MRNEEKIQVLVADDHQVVRMGLLGLINTEEDMQVVAQACDGQKALELYRRHLPNVAVVDISMPLLDGIEVTRRLCAEFPNYARVLVLSALDGDEHIHRALEAGALGYLLKNSQGSSLPEAVRMVSAGKPWMPTEVRQCLARRKAYEELTGRENEVLVHLARGRSTKEIGCALLISEHTAKDHIKSLMRKLRVSDRTEALAIAVQRGIVRL